MKTRNIFALVLVAYSALVLNVLVFKNLPVIRIGHMHFKFGGTREGAANLVPFRSILPYLLGKRGSLIGAVNLIGNIVALMPVGLLLPFIFRSMSWKKALIVAVGSGLGIELMQEIFRVGIFDIDDVILNALGLMLGYRMSGVFTRQRVFSHR